MTIPFEFSTKCRCSSHAKYGGTRDLAKDMLTLGGCLLAFVQQGAGAGFDLYQMGAREDAMGGAVMGLADNAATLYFNPANMTHLPGVQSMAGIVFIAPRATQDLGPYGTYDLEQQWFTPPHLYSTWQLNDCWWVGLAAFSRFGLGTQYDQNWPGKFNNIEIEIQSFSLTPNVAYKINGSLSVSIGFEAMYMDVNMVRALPFPPAGSIMDVEGDSWGYGGNVAFSWTPVEDLGVGLVFRLPVNQEIKGTGCTSLFGGTVQDAEGGIDLPASLALGCNYQLDERLNIGVSATYTAWSSFESLTMGFAPEGSPLPSGSSPKDWNDVWRFSVGSEFKISEEVSLQAGYVYDADPIDYAQADYLVPPGDRHILSLGLRYRTDEVTLGLSYSLLLMESVSFVARPAEGILGTKSKDGYAHMIAVSFERGF